MLQTLWNNTPALLKIAMVTLCWAIIMAPALSWLLWEAEKYLPVWIREILFIAIILAGISGCLLFVQGVAISSALAASVGK